MQLTINNILQLKQQNRRHYVFQQNKMAPDKMSAHQRGRASKTGRDELLKFEIIHSTMLFSYFCAMKMVFVPFFACILADVLFDVCGVVM